MVLIVVWCFRSLWLKAVTAMAKEQLGQMWSRASGVIEGHDPKCKHCTYWSVMEIKKTDSFEPESKTEQHRLAEARTRIMSSANMVLNTRTEGGLTKKQGQHWEVVCCCWRALRERHKCPKPK